MEEIKEARNHKDDGNEITEDLEILEIANSIEGGRRIAERSLWVGGEEPCTIHQVYRILRQVNENWYEPQLASIGPYHRDKEGLKSMEEKKSQCLLALLSRNPALKLEDFLKEIKKLESKARKCYSESIRLESKEFVKMMVLDGSFLVEIFLRIREKKINYERWLPDFIYYDALLLENQLPFFVLEGIFSLVEPNKKTGLMRDLVLGFFELFYVLPLNKDAAMKKSYHHLLDIFHHHCLPKPSQSSSDPGLNQIQTLNIEVQSDPDTNAPLQADRDIEAQSQQDNAKPDPDMEDKSHTNPNSSARWARLASWLGHIRIDRQVRQLIEKWRRKKPEGKRFSILSAEELEEAGINFERKEVEPAGSFLDVEFDKKGVIRIPFLYFSDNLPAIFHNLIAFEQCYPEAGTRFTGYAWFMDDLINTAKDVRILRHAGIIEHGFGSDDQLAQHFNELSRKIFFRGENFHLFREGAAVNDYCRKMWPTWRAKLMRNYFNSPWAILSLIAAVLLLLLTVTQTVFSIFPNV